MSSHPASIDEYLREVQVASWRFQYLEQILKLYLADCYRIIILRLEGGISFKFSYQDVQELPLGALIRLFKKHNGNAGVIELLEGLPKQRNYVAHRAYLMTTEEMRDSATIEPEFKKVRAVGKKADRAVKAVLAEWGAIEALRKKLEVVTGRGDG
jgi:hypothetical protein